MRLLLDTHAVLWWLSDNERLGPSARAAIADPDATVFVSAVSAVEITIKKAKGQLQAPDDLDDQLVRHGFTELPQSVRHGLAMSGLPFHHSDPFDRMLIAQARVEGLTFVTSDRAISAYDLSLLAANH